MHTYIHRPSLCIHCRKYTVGTYVYNFVGVIYICIGDSYAYVYVHTPGIMTTYMHNYFGSMPIHILILGPEVLLFIYYHPLGRTWRTVRDIGKSQLQCYWHCNVILMLIFHIFRWQTWHPVVGTGISEGGGVLQTVLHGEGGGIAEIRQRGVGDFIFGKLTVV